MRWVVHVCYMPVRTLARTVLGWTADGKRSGRSNETRRRTVARELKDCSLTWEKIGHKGCRTATFGKSYV
uniref:Secreted protein n=1 Tax=Arion vulgaris TaxID=1028688 RepID=A0A0B7B7R6_9EUPU